LRFEVVSFVDSKRVSSLCAEAGESARVGNVGAGLVSTTSTTATGFTATTSLTTATASTAELATALAATATLAATEFTAATTASLTTTTATLAATATAASSTLTTLTGRGSKHAVTIELDVDLLLALAFTLGLSLLAGHELLLLLTGQGLALRELLAGALVGLADVLGSKTELLLGLLNKVGGVRLAPVFRLRLGLVLALSSVSDGVLLLSLGDSVTGLLVLELGVAVVCAPAVSGLLLLLTAIC
jgi:hypothetical protein